ncbi:Neutral ceramidase B [Apostichopus japonicus]|uniref:Neutral ceramidase n=1 Tax=Stichopus japonicus TaxID=307972 RepID=A0A2G8K4F6_STIJA|nr:Neutral ceramidase B [Apostichopus japonicus]
MEVNFVLILSFCSILIGAETTTPDPGNAEYIVGAGISDVTGPAADVNMMGYANPSQITGGIHLRIYSRAFIFSHRSNPEKRVVFVSVDCGMQGQGVTAQVIKNLKVKFGSMYTEENVAISGTHTHSTPAGFLNYVLYDVTSLGYVKETFDALVSGITMSIVNADKNMKPADIYVSVGDLKDANINRSPSAYEANPAKERDIYDTNTDHTMTNLKIVDTVNNVSIGMLNWFAVHGTSMNNTNHLISGDNKGFASYSVEQEFNGLGKTGKGPFVAAFAQSHLGDVSPNTQGAKCIDTGKPCERDSSTCGGKNEKCIAFGPGKDMFESTLIIGSKQKDKAMGLWNEGGFRLTGPVSSIHQFVDMTNVTVPYNASYSGKTCKPSMGYSFAAGTTDGPGAFDFTQGTTSSNPFWNLITNLIKKPSKELIECQKPKPILLATGETTFPYSWTPNIVDTMLLKVGQLVIIPVPGEFTTMSGRRMINTVKKALKSEESLFTVIAGLSNTYSDYITTYEEYQVQRYEGASTIYGPHTLQAYLNQYEKLSKALKKVKCSRKEKDCILHYCFTCEDGIKSTSRTYTPNLLSKQLTFLPPVLFDGVPPFTNFGDVLKDVNNVPYKKGSDIVEVTFRAGNPRNNLRLGETFLSVDLKDSISGEFKTIYTDADWSTRFIWTRTSTILGHSEVTVRWDIPQDAPSGTYRISHFGDSKHVDGNILSYQGTSSEFQVS